jgi:hypothetical protein
VLAVGTVTVGLVAALGGFAPALDRGRLVGPGEQILTQRWQIHVDSARLLDDTPEPNEPKPVVEVRLRMEFTGEKTVCCLAERMLEVRYAGQAVTTMWASYEDPRSSGGHDPLVESSRVLEFPLDAARLPRDLPAGVQVVVRDERPPRSLILEEWGVAGAVATVALPCPDERTRR